MSLFTKRRKVRRKKEQAFRENQEVNRKKMVAHFKFIFAEIEAGRLTMS